jgi:hypothetical protein
MSVPTEPNDDVARRFAAIERALDELDRRTSAELFVVKEQIRGVERKTEAHAAGLDALEELLDDLNDGTVDFAEQARAAAWQEQQAQQAQLPVSDLDTEAASASSTTPGTGGPELPDLQVLHAWVEDHIAPMVRKTTTTGEGGGLRWCRTWWLHSDAVERFMALYLAFDELSQDESATWLSVYLRDHLDPHLSTLTSPFGPFYACSPGRHADTFEPLGQQPLVPQPATTAPP